MIRSRHINGQVAVECKGCPKRLVMELLLITNAVIDTVSRLDDTVSRLDDCIGVDVIVEGANGHLYDAEIIDSIGSLLINAITEKASPVWDGVFN